MAFCSHTGCDRLAILQFEGILVCGKHYRELVSARAAENRRNATKHALVEGRTVCPRHSDGVTYVGEPCWCNRWACACGTRLEAQVRTSSYEDTDIAYEAHLTEVGAPLPSLADLDAEQEALDDAYNTRLKEYNAATARLRRKIERAAAREATYQS